MYMRITWGKVQPGLWSAYEQEFKRLVDPTTSGLVARWLVHDTQDPDALYVVTLWESLDAIRKWEASPYFNEKFVPGLRPFILGAYSVSVCEVSYATVAPSLLAAGAS